MGAGDAEGAAAGGGQCGGARHLNGAHADPASGNPHVVRDFLSRREFTFTMESDIYIRYLSFKDKADMRKHIQAKQPHKIDIGAVFSAPVSLPWLGTQPDRVASRCAPRCRSPPSTPP